MQVTQNIRHFLGGVSQADPWLRSADQMRSLLNALVSPVKGLLKRPPLTSLANLAGSLTAPLIHLINYGGDQKFRVVVNSSGEVSVFDAEGGSKTVNNNTSTYLSGASRLRAVTTGDVTYILNPEVTVAADATDHGRTVTDLTHSYLLWVKEVDPEHTYELYVGIGVEPPDYTYTGIAHPGYLAQQMEDDIAGNVLAGYDADQYGGDLGVVVHVIPPGPSVGYVTSENPDAVVVIPWGAKVAGIEDLPPVAPPEFLIEIVGDENTDFDNYFVHFTDGGWKETDDWTQAPEGGYVQFDPETMPVALMYDPEEDEFTLEEFSWEPRASGDNDSNPWASILGDTIDEVFFAEGRLGFLSGNRIVMSRSGQPTNFWRESVRIVRDDDPIDVQSSRSGRFHSAVEYDKRIYLISAREEFLLTGGEGQPLTTRTLKLSPVGSYETTDAFRPFSSGSRLFLLREAGGSTQIIAWEHPEHYPASGVDLTAHVPTYLKGAPSAAAADDSLGFLSVVTDEDPRLVYVCTYILDGQALRMASWGTWEFPGDVQALSMEDGRLVVLLNVGSNSYLGSVNVRNGFSGDFSIAADLGTTPYDMEAELTPIYMRGEDGAAETGGSLKVHHMDLLVDPSSVLTVDVQHKHRPLQSRSYPAGKVRVVVRGEGPDATLTVRCTGANWCCLSGARWEGFYTDRYRPPQ